MKREPIKFEHPWQAAKYVEEGGELYNEGGFMLGQSDAVATAINGEVMYMCPIKQESHWYEKLDSTPENAVLCIDSDARPRIAFTFSDGEIFDEYMDMIHQAMPMEKSEIMLLANNAPE